MIVKSVQVRRFRCFWDQTVECDALTALVGQNGSGKSTFLRALELFYSPNPKIDIRDFCGEDASNNIEIAVIFTGLTSEELSRFEKYVEDGKLRVVRVFSHADGRVTHRYHGFRLLNPDFASVRSANSAREAKTSYESLRSNEKYAQLPTWVNRDQGLAALAEWEGTHPADCSRQIDEGQFFGFMEVAQGYLGKYTKFIAIPAVRDASDDAEEGKGAAITEIMDLVVRSTLASHEELQELRTEAKERYDQIVEPSKVSAMVGLENDLTDTLQQYAPEGAVHLAWLSAGGIDIQLPKAEVKLTEDGYKSSVTRTGHGLQRAFILTMLQYLAKVTYSIPSTSEEPTATSSTPTHETPKISLGVPHLILAIEEPELYQHPSRQRHLSSILLQLATNKTALEGVVQTTQVIYSTHSPAFVGVDRFNQIRLFRKSQGQIEGPRCSIVAQASLTQVAKALWLIHGRQGNEYTEDTLRPRLKPLMTPWLNEGFFADVVVLVEGEEDRAAILGYAKMLGHNFDASGISVIPCMGKNNLDRAALIFDALGIPVYVIWDCDENDNQPDPQFNRCLLRMVGAPEEDFPQRVEDNYACFSTNLTTTLRREIGDEVCELLLTELREEYALPRRDALKNPTIVQEFIERAKIRRLSSTTLEHIIGRIVARKPR